MKKRRIIWAIASFCFLLLLSSCGKAEESYLEEGLSDQEETEISASEEAGSEDVTAAAEPDRIFVYVCGAVKAPGVYELPAGSRIYEAIAMAGGLMPDASETAVNQAMLLSDGEQIYLPTKEEETIGGGPAPEEDDGRININSADEQTLMTLPGIGESKAQAIVSYREEHGPFSDISDLKNIPGIKDGVFNKIKDRIKV